MITPSPGPEFVWRQADHDVFVATVDAEYAGFIDGSPSGGGAPRRGGGGVGAPAPLFHARAG